MVKSKKPPEIKDKKISKIKAEKESKKPKKKAPEKEHPKSELAKVVANNMRKIRVALDLRQVDIAMTLKTERSNYTRKEALITPISLDEMDAFINNYNVLLPDLFLGYSKFIIPPSRMLGMAAANLFPFMETTLRIANQLSEVDELSKDDLEYLRNSFNHALKMLSDTEMKA